jgi:hypothetical protein
MRVSFGYLSVAICAALAWSPPFYYGRSSGLPSIKSSALQNSKVEIPETPNSKQSDSLIEEFSFAIQDFKMDHQSEINNLNINVRYTYVMNIRVADYPDFRFLLKDVEEFLRKYPNKDDYWEVLNKKLTLMLMKKYRVLTSLTSEIVISPSSSDPYLRSSIVTRKRTGMRRAPHRRSRWSTSRKHLLFRSDAAPNR